MLSFSTMGPVYHTPAGTTTRPPPCSESEAMALAKASVERVAPSPVPPKSATLTERAGMAGRATCGMSNGSAEQEVLSPQSQAANDAAAASDIRKCFRFIEKVFFGCFSISYKNTENVPMRSGFFDAKQGFFDGRTPPEGQFSRSAVTSA